MERKEFKFKEKYYWHSTQETTHAYTLCVCVCVCVCVTLKNDFSEFLVSIQSQTLFTIS